MGGIGKLLIDFKTMSDCYVRPACGIPAVRSGEMLPQGIAEFYSLCGGIDVFLSSETPFSLICPQDFVPANPVIIGEEADYDVSSHWYILGKTEDSEYITINTRPESNGYCYDSNHEDHGIVGSCNVIATSFMNLLELLIHYREYWYWLKPDWKYLGDAYDGVIIE